MKFAPTKENVRIIGRTLTIDNILYLGYSCTAIEFVLEGKKAEVTIKAEYPDKDITHKLWMAVVINEGEEPVRRFRLEEGTHTYTLYEGSAEKVTIRLVKMSEAAFNVAGICEIVTDTEKPIVPTKSKKRKLEFIGDSITCGFGVEGLNGVDLFDTYQENPWTAYAARTARILEADYHLVSWSGIGIISSYIPEDVDQPLEEPLMPELYQYTDKALEQAIGRTSYTKWDTQKYLPDCIVVNLGTNDQSYTRGKKDRIETFGIAYAKFLENIRQENPTAVIVCVLGVMGQELYPEIEKQVTLRKDAGDNRIYACELNLQLEADGIGAEGHPSLLTHKKLAEQLTSYLRKCMDWK